MRVKLYINKKKSNYKNNFFELIKVNFKSF